MVDPALCSLFVSFLHIDFEDMLQLLGETAMTGADCFIFVIAWGGIKCVWSGLGSQALRREYVKTLGHLLAILVKQSTMPSPRPPALRVVGSLAGTAEPQHMWTPRVRVR